MSNLQFPYSTANQFLKPKYTIENTTDLKITSNYKFLRYTWAK